MTELLCAKLVYFRRKGTQKKKREPWTQVPLNDTVRERTHAQCQHRQVESGSVEAMVPASAPSKQKKGSRSEKFDGCEFE